MKCREIAGKSYSNADTNIDCDSDFYNNTIFPINITILLVMGVIIPLIIGIKLY